MKCNSAWIPLYHDSWLDGLNAEVKESLEKLFLGVGTHTMTFWFVAHADMPAAVKD